MAGFENDVVFAKNADFSQLDNQAPVEANGLVTDGQLWIGSTALNVGSTHINVGTLTSPLGTVDIGFSTPNITLDVTSQLQVIRGPTIDFKTIGDTPMYTFADDFVICGFMYINATLTGVVALDSESNIGWTAPNYDDVIGAFSGTLLPTILGNEWGNFLATVFNEFPVVPAGQTLTWRVTSIETGASVYTNRIDVVGYYKTGSTASSSPVALTITGDSGGPISPSAGNWNLVGGTNVNVAGSGSSLTINAPVGGVTWTDVTGTSQAMSANAGYTANNAGLVTLTLPGTATYGSTFDVVGKGAGGWSIAQNAGQTIHFNSTSTTTGAGGSLASTVQYNTVKLLCTVADTDFTVIASEGNLTVV